MEIFFACWLPYFFLVFIALIIFRGITSTQDREKQKTAWRRLSATHKLNFVSDHNLIGNGSYLAGIYRNHALRLETIEKGEGRTSITYTRVGVQVQPWYGDSLSNDQRGQFLSFQEALDRFTSPNSDFSVNEEIKVESRGHPIYFEQRGLIQDTKFLQYLFDLLTYLAEAYPVVVALGGEAVPALELALQNRILEPIIEQILRDIAHETSKKLGDRAPCLLCSRCLTRFTAHELQLSWWTGLTYYGCRRCSQSRDFYEGSVVAVLNSQMADAPVQQDGVIRVNWSTRRELFDFDTVEIVQASDEEVERFAVQVGNDTDETRESRYQEMQCVVHPNCQLSENTLRILERMFGQVERSR
jgi:hypothetical protein